MALTESMVVGGGCFWCLEAAFQLIPGVSGVEPGYAGGALPNPDYKKVGSGLTGHAEVVRVSYDPALIGYGRLLDWFFRLHDSTTPDRQGADRGPQYRSIILYADEGQRLTAERVLHDQAANFEGAIVTELLPLQAFWPAEAEHRDFFRRNPDYSYCRVVVRPKVDKLQALLADPAAP